MLGALGRCVEMLLVVLSVGTGTTFAGDQRIRVLFVGGDWKAQLPGLRGDFRPQRGREGGAGDFRFYALTTYEFLQYGDAESLRAFDVVAVGDLKGQSVVPRLMEGLTRFVRRRRRVSVRRQSQGLYVPDPGVEFRSRAAH